MPLCSLPIRSISNVAFSPSRVLSEFLIHINLYFLQQVFGPGYRKDKSKCKDSGWSTELFLRLCGLCPSYAVHPTAYGSGGSRIFQATVEMLKIEKHLFQSYSLFILLFWTVTWLGLSACAILAHSLNEACYKFCSFNYAPKCSQWKHSFPLFLWRSKFVLGVLPPPSK